MSQSFLYEDRKDEIRIGTPANRKGRLQCVPHLHRHLEMVYMVEGNSVGYADTVHAEIHSEDIFLSFPNQIHFYESFAPETYYLFIFSPDLIPEFSEIFSLSLPKSPIIKGAGRDPEIKRLLMALVDNETQKKNTPYAKNLRRGYLLSLLSLLIPQMELEQISISDSGALRAIVSYCTSNFSENLSLSLLEEKLHLNKYYISHLFSKKLGLRFNDYINSLRVSEACRYLLNTNNSITEISETVGFNTQRTFNRAFIKSMGVTPGEYRKKNFLSASKK